MTSGNSDRTFAKTAALAGAAAWLVAAAIMTPPALAQTAGPAAAPAAPQTAAPPPPGAPTVPPPSTVATPTLPPQPPPPALPNPPETQRGFLNGIGQWWEKSVADWKAKVKEDQVKLDKFNKQSAEATQQAMKNAADAMRLSHVIEIQQTCPVAGNGAADCATAATNVCKAKGYGAGQPLDVRTAEKCNDSLWVSGHAPTAADCPVETVLLRVACQ